MKIEQIKAVFEEKVLDKKGYTSGFKAIPTVNNDKQIEMKFKMPFNSKELIDKINSLSKGQEILINAHIELDQFQSASGEVIKYQKNMVDNIIAMEAKAINDADIPF